MMEMRVRLSGMIQRDEERSGLVGCVCSQRHSALSEVCACEQQAWLIGCVSDAVSGVYVSTPCLRKAVAVTSLGEHTLAQSWRHNMMSDFGSISLS